MRAKIEIYLYLRYAINTEDTVSLEQGQQFNSEIEPQVSFVRDVMPVLSKVGCNAGTCHGAAKGKNGFKLSLRGYDPEFDHQSAVPVMMSLVRQLLGVEDAVAPNGTGKRPVRAGKSLSSGVNHAPAALDAVTPR